MGKKIDYFIFIKMAHYQMRLMLVVRLEVLSETLFAPSSFAAHLVGRLTVFQEPA